MPIRKNQYGVWQIDLEINGTRIRRSARTKSRKEAIRMESLLRTQMWEQSYVDAPDTTRHRWQDAVVRWFDETQDKADRRNDETKLRWLHPYLGDLYLDEIDRKQLESIAAAKAKEGAAPATVNRHMALISAILNKAWRHWGWLTSIPAVPKLKEPDKRIRWLAPEEAERLIEHLPHPVSDMARFTLATGLREANVRLLEWGQIDMGRRHAWIHPDQAKARKAIAVPLNQLALQILDRARGNHERWVWPSPATGNPYCRLNNTSWIKALRLAGIEDLRWHDLRHTWASWHIQRGTPPHVLQELGGWASIQMVQRYAHLGVDHLAQYAENVVVV